MKKTLFLITAVVVLVSALILGGCAEQAQAPTTPTTPTPTKTLTIGAITMLTGPASQGGLAYKQGWQLVVDKYNDAGGLKVGNDTYKLNIIVEDDQMSPEQGATAATKLVSQDKVKIVVGGMIPPIKSAIYSVTSKAGVLYAMVDGVNASAAIPYPTNVDVAPDKPLLIRTYHSYDETVPGLLDYLVENYPNVKTIALNAITEDTSEPFEAYVQEEMAKRGLKQVGNLELFAPDLMDYVPLVTRILASKPDAIYCMIGGPIAAGGELKAARDLGWKGPLFYSIHADVALQAMIVGPGTSDMFGANITLADPTTLSQAVKDVQTQYLKKYPEREFIADVVSAYDGLWVLFQTIEKAKSLDPETILKTYESLTQTGDLQTTLGPAYVGGLKTCGVNRVICAPYVIGRVTDGKATNVETIMVDVP